MVTYDLDKMLPLRITVLDTGGSPVSMAWPDAANRTSCIACKGWGKHKSNEGNRKEVAFTLSGIAQFHVTVLFLWFSFSYLHVFGFCDCIVALFVILWKLQKWAEDPISVIWAHYDLESVQKSKADDVSSSLTNAAETEAHSQMWILTPLGLPLSLNMASDCRKFNLKLKRKHVFQHLVTKMS